jgi:uncharacterized membrane protein
MTKFSLKSTIVRGIALAFPLSVVLYVLYKFIKIFEKIIGPIAKKFEIERVFGEITLTFFCSINYAYYCFFTWSFNADISDRKLKK